MSVTPEKEAGAVTAEEKNGAAASAPVYAPPAERREDTLRVLHVIDTENEAALAFAENVLTVTFASVASAIAAPKTVSDENTVKRICALTQNANIPLYACPFDTGFTARGKTRKQLGAFTAQSAPHVIHAHGGRAAEIVHLLREAAGYKFYPVVHSFYAEENGKLKRAELRRVKLLRDEADIVLHADKQIKTLLAAAGAAGADDPVLPSARKVSDTAAKLISAYRSVSFMQRRLSLYSVDRLTGE